MIRLKQIMDIVKQILSECQAEKRGRPARTKQGAPVSYSRHDVLLILLLKALKGWSINHTHRKLVDDLDASWREMLRLQPEEIPSRRWLNELAQHQAVKALRKRVMHRLQRRLLSHIDLTTLVVDLTPIEVQEAWDKLTNWGRTSDEESFYGYKLHLLCTADGLPLAIRVTRANGHELNEVIPLFKEAAYHLGQATEEVDFVLGDAAYDANDVYDGAQEHLTAQLQADVNRRNAHVSDQAIRHMTPETARQLASHQPRQQALLRRYSAKGKQRQAQRTIIEELFGILKELLPAFTDLKWYQAGIRRVREHFRWLFFAFVAILVRNHSHHEPFLGIKMVVS